MTGPVHLADAIAATWPAEKVARVGPFTLGFDAGGGNRVSAARLSDTASDGSEITASEIEHAAAAQREAGQPALFMVFEWQTALDRTLEGLGYGIRDTTDILSVPAADIAEAPPPVTCFDIWPPLAVQEDIWREAGIGAARLAIMQRVIGPKSSLFGRMNDHPAGTAFVALHGDVAMLHALEIARTARRHGLASIMMRAAADWALREGARDLAVLVTTANAPAQSLYAALGLGRVGTYRYRIP